MSCETVYAVVVSAPRVKYSDLEEAFLFSGSERYYWLDKLTGTIRSYGEEARRAIEAGNVDDLPEWMEAEIEDAREVLSGFGELPSSRDRSQSMGPCPPSTVERQPKVTWHATF